MKRLFLIIVLLLPTNVLAQTDECNLSIETEPMPIIVSASIEGIEIEVNSNCPCEYEVLASSDKWISFNYLPLLECPGTLDLHIQQNLDYFPREGYAFIGVVTSSGQMLGKQIHVIQEGTLPVNIEIKPGSCPNTINTKSKGMITIAVAGNEQLDVSTIDPLSIRLSRQGGYHRYKMAPSRWSIEDEVTPLERDLCECHESTTDGFPDLILKFETKRVTRAFSLDSHGGETMPFMITGNLYEEYGSSLIEGWDCFHILPLK